MKTGQDIVAEIELLGNRLGNLESSQTSNLNLNLGLSNLGLLHQDRRFQASFSNLLSEIQAVYDEYKKWPSETHCDLQAILDAVKIATSLIHEVLDTLADDELSVLDASVFVERFAKAIEPFAHLQSYNSRDPIYISMHAGGTYTDNLHGDRTKMEELSANGIVRISQFFRLLSEIQKSYNFILERLYGDAEIILKNLEAANEISLVGRRGLLGYLDTSGNSSNIWSEEVLPADDLIERIQLELLCIDRLYLSITGAVTWEDFLWHLEGIFNREIVKGMTGYFEKEDGLIVTIEGEELPILNYDGISEGMSEIRKLERAYESWYEEFDIRRTH